MSIKTTLTNYFESLTDFNNYLKTVNDSRYIDFRISFDNNLIYTFEKNINDPVLMEILSNPLFHANRLIEIIVQKWDEDEQNEMDERNPALMHMILEGYLNGTIPLTDPYLVRQLSEYYEKDEDPLAIDVMADLINKYVQIHTKQSLEPRNEEDSEEPIEAEEDDEPIKDNELVAYPFNPLNEIYEQQKTLYKLMPKLRDLDEYMKTVEDWKNPYIEKIYKKVVADRVLDTALGLRQTGLPPYVVENIASYANNTTGFKLYELMNMITPVVERKPQVVQEPVLTTRKKRRVRKKVAI